MFHEKIIVFESELLVNTITIGLDPLEKPVPEDLKLKNKNEDSLEDDINTNLNDSISVKDKDFFEYLRRYQSIIGQKGEKFVIDFEKEKLKNTQYYGRIEHISQTDDSAGYDILSFETDGTELYIEVKTTDKNYEFFYITQNEIEKAKSIRGCGKKYLIYRVIDILSNPTFSVIEDLYDDFTVEPIVWKVKKSSKQKKL